MIIYGEYEDLAKSILAVINGKIMKGKRGTKKAKRKIYEIWVNKTIREWIEEKTGWKFQTIKVNDWEAFKNEGV